MTRKEIAAYYDDTMDSAVRDDLVAAADLVNGDLVAVDCGCGSGSDIAYLLNRGFTVHGFDLEPESIARCRERFSGNENVFLTQASFSEFSYPTVSLVVADASLFFCPSPDFDSVWQDIVCSLTVGGMFVGSFLGPRDSMASSSSDAAFWTNVSVFTGGEVKSLFDGFEILRCVEHELDGETSRGMPHHWHIFAVVARKLG